MLKVVLRICDIVSGGEPLFVSIHSHRTCISTPVPVILQVLRRVFSGAKVILSLKVLGRWFESVGRAVQSAQ